MAGHYIALLGAGDAGDAGTQHDSVQALLLENAGLHKRFDANGIRLFASPDVPVLETPGGDLLLGHLFLRNGEPVTSAAKLPNTPDPAHFRAAITKELWGEYVLLQSTAGEYPKQFVVSRAPSDGLPCFFSPETGQFFVTSDITLATRIGLYEREIDWTYVAQYLAYPFVKTGRTALSGVRELLPGGSVHIGGLGPEYSQNWSPWDFVSPKRLNPKLEDAAAGIRRAVETAVRGWTQVDHSILLELSGGLDSSILAACLGRSAARVVCTTLVPTLPGADERQYASAVAESAGLRLRTEALTVDQGRIDSPFPQWLISPRVGPLQLAVDAIMQEVADEERLDAFWSGGGGDTVFCYLGSAAPAADAFIKLRPVAGCRAVRALSDLHQCTTWKAARLTWKKIRSFRPKPPAADMSFLAPRLSVEAPEPHPWASAAGRHAPGDVERVLGLAATQAFLDGVPRATIRRLRLPLLSQPVVEACLGVPTWLWISGGINRAVARTAFADLLPDNVANRRSKGDFIQYLAAIYRQNKDHIRELLFGGELEARGFLDATALAAFLDRPLAARDQTFVRVFDLCTIESWIRQQP